MARKPSSHRNPWSKRDLQILKNGPKTGKSQAEIARLLRTHAFGDPAEGFCGANKIQVTLEGEPLTSSRQFDVT